MHQYYEYVVKQELMFEIMQNIMETIMGKALIRLQKEDPKLWRRSDIVVTTKLFWGPGGGQNELGSSRKHIMEGING